MDRWETLGRIHRAPLEQWRERILAARKTAEGFEALLKFLAEPNHDTEPIKSCSPFVGLPTTANPTTT